MRSFAYACGSPLNENAEIEDSKYDWFDFTGCMHNRNPRSPSTNWIFGLDETDLLIAPKELPCRTAPIAFEVSPALRYVHYHGLSILQE